MQLNFNLYANFISFEVDSENKWLLILDIAHSTEQNTCQQNLPPNT